MATLPGSDRPRDPVCGMAVRLDAAIPEGLVAEHDAHTYYFCRASCREQFTADPSRFVSSHAHAAEATTPPSPEIDAGMRQWYESCSCCLSDAFPEVKAALDAERDARAEPVPAPGICEVAEAAADSR